MNFFVKYSLKFRAKSCSNHTELALLMLHLQSWNNPKRFLTKFYI